MLSTSKLFSRSLARRCISTTQSTNFKFKLTEELSNEYEQKEKERLAAEKPPEQALHTKESSLIMARVSHDRYKKVVKCGVPKHRLNSAFLLYVRESDNVQAFDENDLANPGDWVLLRRWPESTDEKVTHKVEKVAYQYGNYIDPLTKKRAFGLYYDDDMKRLEEIKLDMQQ